MRMDQLLDNVAVLATRGPIEAVDVRSIELDSREVVAGSLFCCVKGSSSDGHDHAGEAVRRGAVALLVERFLPLDVPQVLVEPGAMRRVMARLSSTLYGDPSGSLVVIGVTGTNGKTTTTHLLASVLGVHGWPASVIGTLDGARTTPEAPYLQRLLADARSAGRKAVAMEVSSHALAQGRVDAVHFTLGVFTNLSHDHLDYHGGMEEYFKAKASLFKPGMAEQGVAFADDPWGRRLLAEAKIPMTPFSRGEAGDVDLRPAGTDFSWRGRRVHLALPGEHNVVNALGAATAAMLLGVEPDEVVEGLGKAARVPGRFEPVDTGASFHAFVDYAHTPDALEVALRNAATLAAGGRVIVVFGCGGERDRLKRPMMGAIAARHADVAVLTGDNPRREDPASIMRDVLSGVPQGSQVVTEPDRRSAIELAVSMALPGDVVVVAGKGHETTIDLGGEKLPFDDRVELAQAIAKRIGEVRGSGEGIA